MTADPRCTYPGCNKRADVWWKGPWCGLHADAQYGRVPAFVASFEDVAGETWESPATGRTAIMGGSLPVGEPSSPLTEAELFDILERDHWNEA